MAGIEFRFLGGQRQTSFSVVWRFYWARRGTQLGLHFSHDYDCELALSKCVFVAWATLLVSPSINYATKGGGGVTSTTVMVFNGFRWCGRVNTKECSVRSPVMLCSHLQPISDSCLMCGCSYPAPFVLPTSFLSISFSPSFSVIRRVFLLLFCFMIFPCTSIFFPSSHPI